MRRAIWLIVGAALAYLGAWCGYEQPFLHADVRAATLTGAAFLILIGAYFWVGQFDSRKSSAVAKQTVLGGTLELSSADFRIARYR